MRSYIHQFIALSILFMGVDRAWDIGIDTHTVDTFKFDHSHAQITPVELQNPEMPEPTGTITENQSCGHICHVLSYSITAQTTELISFNLEQFYQLKPVFIRSRAQAPPTPPPNA